MLGELVPAAAAPAGRPWPTWATAPSGRVNLVNLQGRRVRPLTPPFRSALPYLALPAAPRAPPLVHVTTEGPTELQASWVPAPGARDGYQVTLYLGGGLAGSRTLVAGVGGTSFSALTPGTRYDVEVVARAGPLLLAATTASGWTCEWGLQRPQTPAPP